MHNKNLYLFFYIIIFTVLTSCQTNPVKQETTKKDKAESLIEDIHHLARTHADEKTIAVLIKNGADLHAKDNIGNTAFHYIVATRSPALIQLALEHGADINQTGINGKTALDFLMLGRHSTKYEHKKNSIYLFADKTSTSEQKPKAEDVEQNISRTASVLALFWQTQQVKAKQQQWQSTADDLSQTKEKLQQAIPQIEKPALPAIATHKKSVFETIKSFQNRMAVAKQQRQQQTEQIFRKYRSEVEARNKKVKQRQQDLAQLKKDVAQLNKQQQAFINSLPLKIKNKQHAFMAQAFALNYGSPIIEHILLADGQAKYDAENSALYAKLAYSNVSFEQLVKISIAPEKAEAFYNALKNGSLFPTAEFKVNKDNSISFVKLTTSFDNKTYFAKASSTTGFVVQKPIEVILQTTQQAPKIIQSSIHFQVFDENMAAQLVLQNPNIKDVAFEAYVLAEQKEFNDDIPQLLASVKAAPIDRTKWLFVVGIGNYTKTDDILYSTRSAQYFAKTAAKTLGIQQGRQIVLLDGNASSGSIKDELKLMLSKVRKGDKIYFYYSGHGIPVVEKNNDAYLLPADKIPDFVADDDFYKAENIYKQLKNSKASQVIAFMDSCFTGQADGKSVFGGTKAATRLAPKSIKFDKNDKMAVLTAGNSKQFSNAFVEKGHRLFSYYLMKAMLKGYENIGDLATRVTADVTETSLDMGGTNRQTPVLQGNTKLKL